jgi:hypothetical protein
MKKAYGNNKIIGSYLALVSLVSKLDNISWLLKGLQSAGSNHFFFSNNERSDHV